MAIYSCPIKNGDFQWQTVRLEAGPSPIPLSFRGQYIKMQKLLLLLTVTMNLRYVVFGMGPGPGWVDGVDPALVASKPQANLGDRLELSTKTSKMG